MRRTSVLPVLALVGALALSGCGGSDGTSDGSSTAASAPASAAESPSAATGDAPADPAAAKAEIMKNYAAFFDGKSTGTDKVKFLEDGAKLSEALALAGKNPNKAEASAVVKSVEFTSATEANVTYDLLTSGKPSLSDASGAAVLQDGTWKVSAATFCTLAKLASGDPTTQLAGCP